MASQITHIPYGKKVLDTFFSDKPVDEQKFYLGTLFPDIRIFGYIDRESSHAPHPSLKSIGKIKGDFEKGMYVHSLVDIERERVIKELGVLELLGGHTRYTVLALKAVEDQITYSLVSDWSKFVTYLNTILPEEENLVPKNIAKKWHLALKVLFSHPPDWQSQKDFSAILQADDSKELKLIKTEMEKITSNREVMNKIKEIYPRLFEKN